MNSPLFAKLFIIAVLLTIYYCSASNRVADCRKRSDGRFSGERQTFQADLRMSRRSDLSQIANRRGILKFKEMRDEN